VHRPGPHLHVGPGLTVSASTAHAGGAATALAGTWAVTYTQAEFFAAGAAPDEDDDLAFEAGPHQGFNVGPTAIQEFCAALS
jgi:hypothetical protein